MKLHQVIRQYRENARMTQESMSFELSMTQSAYAKIEQGVTAITVDRLFQISKVLQVSVCEILGEEPKKHDCETKEAMLKHIEDLKSEVLFLRGLLEK